MLLTGERSGERYENLLLLSSVGFRKNYRGRVGREFWKVRKVAFSSVFFKLLAAIQGNGKVSCVTTLKRKQRKGMAGYRDDIHRFYDAG